ncbi:virion core protein [Skunkpox virus]|uniref:Virion core protein n=1 Tax=Skunkpox virus TaxID=160796 RepID=A0A1C9KBR0_9POXV|nr:virion core protein [Skunkpox virus]AOP31585.1 virion core protein [Skunkpox virus]
MSINIDIKKITDLLNSSILFPDDVKELLQEKYIVLERKSNGMPAVAHIYKNMARFDNKSIYRIAKFLFRKRPDVIKLLLLEDVEPLSPDKSIHISVNNLEYQQLEGPIGTKTALLELFNAFRTGRSEPIPYYYLPLRKDINNIVSK